jgi:glycolate oxidase iron-sulfur subunit
MEDKSLNTVQKTLIDQNLLNACIHCGLCLPACPTYLATGRELESPRGRIYLLNLWQQKKEPFSERMAEHLDSCLGCFGCQTACPSGVNYEAIFNQAKAQVNMVTPFWLKFPRYLAFKWLLPNDALLKIAGNFLRFWQQSKADKALHVILAPFTKMSMIKEILRWQSLMPSVPMHQDLPATSIGCDEKAAIVHLFKGCIMDIFYNQVNRESIALLALSASSVQVPEQTCCGALALHSGERSLARQLAQENIAKFACNSGPIVVTASGCAAMLKSYPELFDKDDAWHDKAKVFSSRIQDLPEFLAKHDFAILNKNVNNLSKPMSVGYHAACHLSHAQGIRLAPKLLLENFAQAINTVAGKQVIKLIPLMEEEHCCGSAGIYNLGHPILSEKILNRKMEMIKNSGVSLIVTTNPGCMLQLESGIKQQSLDIQVLHLATLLSKAYLSSF